MSNSLVPKPGQPMTLTPGHIRYFEMLENPDDYSDLEFTEKEIEHISRSLNRLALGSFTAIPLKCWPGRCPFVETCPFQSIGKAPGGGRNCLVEINILKEWTAGFISEYDIRPEDFTDRFLIQELVEIELSLYRINSCLSDPENASFVEEQAVGVDREGNPVVRKEIVQLLEVKVKLWKRKDQIIKRMVGDRQEKVKAQALLKQSTGDDISSQSVALKKELERLQRQLLEATPVPSEPTVQIPSDDLFVVGEDNDSKK